MQRDRAQLFRGLVEDLLFVAGLGLYGWGLWRVIPEAAPLIGGATLMALAAAIHYLGARDAA